MLHPGCLPLIAILFTLVLLPFFFAHVMVTALTKLGLHPSVALMALFGIVFGGSINLPVKRIPREERYLVDPITLFGFGQMFPRFRVSRTYTTLAVNVGGCLIPVIIALYEILRVAAQGLFAFLILVIVTLFNVFLCFRMARPIAGIGITMPALVPPFAAALPSIILIPNFAPPVAFVAGVLGPLIGADLLHLREVRRIATGMASIGGAGTFDGIVLSGLIAAVLA